MSELFRYTNFPDEPAEFQSKDDELNQLRAENAELSATIAKQARQLAEAREIIEPFSIIGDVFSKQDNHDDSSWTNIPDDDLISCGWKHLTVRIKNFRAASNWIASNPAPQQQDDAQ